jgi:hypothetical protein
MQSLLDRQHNTHGRHRHRHPSNGGDVAPFWTPSKKTCRRHRHPHRKMKNMRVGINKSNQFKFLSRKRLLSKRSFLAQNMERETHNGGRKLDKKMAIDKHMGGDGQECLEK